tara:strand:+ start:43282 stop:43740 length:459 start_codon:yes stop_codon:yes gene_type:complete
METPWYIYVLLIFSAVLSYFIRTRNLKLLVDVTTNDFIPINSDGFLFLRYAQQIINKGTIIVHDVFRYFPFGFDTTKESTFLSYFVANLFKFLNFFNSDLTLNYVSVIYPPLNKKSLMLNYICLINKYQIFSWYMVVAKIKRRLLLLLVEVL